MSAWKEEARAHWKEFRPKYYQELKQSGQLEAALDRAVQRTTEEAIALEDAGLQTHEAFEMVREQYLFPPEENPEPETPMFPPDEEPEPPM